MPPRPPRRRLFGSPRIRHPDTRGAFKEPCKESRTFVAAVEEMVRAERQPGFRTYLYTFTTACSGSRDRLHRDLRRRLDLLQQTREWRRLADGLWVIADDGREDPHIHAVVLLPPGMPRDALRNAWTGGISNARRVTGTPARLGAYLGIQWNTSPRNPVTRRRKWGRKRRESTGLACTRGSRSTSTSPSLPLSSGASTGCPSGDPCAPPSSPRASAGGEPSSAPRSAKRGARSPVSVAEGHRVAEGQGERDSCAELIRGSMSPPLPAVASHCSSMSPSSCTPCSPTSMTKEIQMSRPDAARFAPEFLEMVNAKAKNAAQKVIVKEVVKEATKQLKKALEARIESRLAVEGAATPAEMMTVAQEIAAELLDQLFGAEKAQGGPQKAPEAPVTGSARQAPAPYVYPGFRPEVPAPAPADAPPCPASTTTNRPAGYQEPAPYPSTSGSRLPPGPAPTPVNGEMPPPFWPTISPNNEPVPTPKPINGQLPAPPWPRPEETPGASTANVPWIPALPRAAARA